MNYLSFIKTPTKTKQVPLTSVTIGSNQQPYINRSVGLPYHQIFITKKGTGVFRLFGKGDIRLQKGDIIIITAGTCHEYFPLAEEWHLGFIGFEGKITDILLETLNFNHHKKISIDPITRIWKQLEEIWYVAKQNKDNLQWEVSKHLYALLLEIKKRARISNELKNNEYSNDHIQKVADYIRDHYSKSITINSLSAMSGYSSHHFSRLFRKIYGMTPNQYVNKIRLEKAKYLLEEEKDLKVSNAAQQVGIEVNYFIRIFRERYNITPGEYQKGYHQGKYTDIYYGYPVQD